MRSGGKSSEISSRRIAHLSESKEVSPYIAPRRFHRGFIASLQSIRPLIPPHHGGQHVGSSESRHYPAWLRDFDVSARMPRDAILPIHRDLLGSLPNESRRVQQKIDPRRERSGAESIHGGKSACSKAVSPVLHLGMMTTFATRLVVIHDQAPPWPREFVYLADHDALA